MAWFIFISIFIGVTILDIRQARIRKNQNRWNEFREKRRDLALPCPECRKLAAPIPRTGNRYRCTCGNQFAGDRHDLVPPEGTPHWLVDAKGRGSAYMTPYNAYYEAEVDPLSDRFDPQKDWRDTRWYKDLMEGKLDAR